MRPRRIANKSKELPFSCILLLLAILEASIWSIGVLEDPICSKEFLVDHNSNLRLLHLTKLIELKEVLLTLRFIEQQKRLNSEKEREFESTRNFLDNPLQDTIRTDLLFLFLEEALTTNSKSKKGKTSGNYNNLLLL